MVAAESVPGKSDQPAVDLAGPVGAQGFVVAYEHVYFVVPQPDLRLVPASRERWFRNVLLRHFDDGGQLAMIYGEVFATLTGQRLRVRSRSRPGPAWARVSGALGGCGGRTR
ncbi:hypothetical protein Acor_84400 [Acrocarpospora corrugata]|uniref:Uncharacterized protein n=1 Tax=Acrocarpospora corrugata TaxID=35763 RepID=A0A5M3WGY8_9ACTN|nr:hypothetical protein Acor_84400 [Acrocarpospora corrugata]